MLDCNWFLPNDRYLSFASLLRDEEPKNMTIENLLPSVISDMDDERDGKGESRKGVMESYRS